MHTVLNSKCLGGLMVPQISPLFPQVDQFLFMGTAYFLIVFSCMNPARGID